MKLKATCSCRALAPVERTFVTLNEVKGLGPSVSRFFAEFILRRFIDEGLRMTCGFGNIHGQS